MFNKTNSNKNHRKYDQYSAFDSRKHASIAHRRKMWKRAILTTTCCIAIIIVILVVWLYV